jgi:hypothetical protein
MFSTYEGPRGQWSLVTDCAGGLFCDLANYEYHSSMDIYFFGHFLNVFLYHATSFLSFTSKE